MKIYITIIAALTLLVSSHKAESQEWIVPQEAKEVKNSEAYNKQNVKEGKTLFMANCKSCHGEPGKYNALSLTPPPPDVASEKMIANSVGSLYFKITSGRGAMPTFEKTLTETQRWNVINYLKSFDPINAGIIVDTPPIKARLQASVAEESSIISASAQIQSADSQYVAFDKAIISVMVKKAFGSIEIGKMKTNEKGFAEFHFPKTYNGDYEGKVSVELLLSDDYKYTPVDLNSVKIATPHTPENLLTERVLWSTNDHVQWWVLLSYVGVVVAIWGAIGYIIFLLLQIRSLKNEVE